MPIHATVFELIRPPCWEICSRFTESGAELITRRMCNGLMKCMQASGSKASTSR
jgi:hypothetical protein